jgi:transcriptional regulator with XRE-family HTH domain
VVNRLHKSVLTDVPCCTTEARGRASHKGQEPTMDTPVVHGHFTDELDELLRSQPAVVQDAAEDAEEYFRLMRTLTGVRKRSKSRQKDVAREMGTTQSAISDLERVRTDPQVSTLFRYARSVGCRVRMVASVEDVLRATGPHGWSQSVRPAAKPRLSKRHASGPRVIDAASWRSRQPA